MPTIGDLFQKYGARYIQEYRVPVAHLKVMDAIRNCRTSALGGHAWVCTSCGGMHVHYNSPIGIGAGFVVIDIVHSVKHLKRRNG